MGPNLRGSQPGGAAGDPGSRGLRHAPLRHRAHGLAEVGPPGHRRRGDRDRYGFRDLSRLTGARLPGLDRPVARHSVCRRPRPAGGETAVEGRASCLSKASGGLAPAGGQRSVPRQAWRARGVEGGVSRSARVPAAEARGAGSGAPGRAIGKVSGPLPDRQGENPKNRPGPHGDSPVEYGLETAHDLEARAILGVPGFGHMLTQKLLGWRQSIESKFVFDPTKGVDPADIADLDRTIAARKIQIERVLQAGSAELEEDQAPDHAPPAVASPAARNRGEGDRPGRGGSAGALISCHWRKWQPRQTAQLIYYYTLTTMTNRKAENDDWERASGARRKGRGFRILSSFARNPVVALLGLFCTIAGFFLGIYFQLQTSPKLTFAVKPGRLEVVSDGQSPHLSVRHKGFIVKGDITSVRVALWNAGRLPIKNTDILRPVAIYTNPPVSILVASLKPFGHTDLTGFRVDTEQLPQGRLLVNWDVLLKEDGAYIDIIYNGPPDIKIAASGIVLGQEKINVYQNQIGFASPLEEYEAERTVNERKLVFAPALALIFFISLVGSTLRARKETDKFKRRALISLAILSALTITICAMMYWTSRYPAPPPSLDETMR